MRPPKPAFESPPPPTKETPSPTSPQYQPQFPYMQNVRAPSPLTVTVTPNPNYHVDLDETLEEESPHDVIPLDERNAPNVPSMEQKPAPVFRGFTDQEQKNFFQAQPSPNVVDKPVQQPLLIPAARRKPFPKDSLEESNDSQVGSSSSVNSSSGSGQHSVEDKTRLFIVLRRLVPTV